MAKLIAMMKRKAGVSREEFRRYYEERHAPLAARHFSKYFAGYRRNYPSMEFLVDNDVLRGPADRDAQDDGYSYDVITEFWYHDRQAMDDMFKAFAKVNDEIVSDEDAFIDRTTLRVFVVDETVTDLSKSG